VSQTHVIVIGAGARGRCAATELLAAGITDVAILDKDTGEVVSSVFDDATHTWELRTTSGETFRAAVVIAAYRPVYVPWIPELEGRNEFRGVSFHAARWDPDFDPSGKRIAVIGTDATAGHYLGQLTASAASVTVFAHAPRRIVDELPLPATRVKRWLRRLALPRADRSRPALVRSSISAVTPSGIRTGDGVDHRADAIIYGTGFAIPNQTPDATLVGAGGLTIRQAWDAGMEPFLGVAIHGFPNYFFINGPAIDAQARYVAECVGLLNRTSGTRIEVLRSSQQVFNERAHFEPAEPFRVQSAFDLSSRGAGDEETYDGMATLTMGDTCLPVRVRLTGHLDPIDGYYHWQGTVFSSPSQPLPDEATKQARTATLTVGERSAPARIVERTPWGTHSVAGVGAPPYAP
jgi:cation diffusion facilitator CzcD-associated flavoprotein CzcO